jgi:hypothetical protein
MMHHCTTTSFIASDPRIVQQHSVVPILNHRPTLTTKKDDNEDRMFKEMTSDRCHPHRKRSCFTPVHPVTTTTTTSIRCGTPSSNQSPYRSPKRVKREVIDLPSSNNKTRSNMFPSEPAVDPKNQTTNQCCYRSDSRDKSTTVPSEHIDECQKKQRFVSLY